MGQSGTSRRALEERVAAQHELRLVRGPNEEDVLSADLVIATLDRSGCGLLGRLISRSTAVPPPVLLVVDESFEGLAATLWFGVRGIVASSVDDRELVDCALLVAGGWTVLPEGALYDEGIGDVALTSEWVLRRDAQEVLGKLSRRELEVLTLVGAGRNNAEIAAQLWLSENTVRSHVQRLMRKLALRNRLCLVIFAHELGLVGSTGR
ncbi:response regulator transcription factor [Streptomyces luteireticuli]|uniref:response regulator transcription factor n=1 Tax=Streptomyces luteireticuli TaxID=173858 RepID=UPI003558F796